MGRESRSSSRSSTAASVPVAKKTGSAAAKRAQAAAEEEAIRQDDELTVMVLINDNDRSGPDRLGVLPKTKASAKKQKPGKSRKPTTSGKARTLRSHGPAPIAGYVFVSC